MITNTYLKELYEQIEKYDLDSVLNQLLEYLHRGDKGFISNIKQETVELDEANEKEIFFLTLAATLLDYRYTKLGLERPEWIFDSRLKFEDAYFHSSRHSADEKLEMIKSHPNSFKSRNCYFDLHGISRI